MFYAYRKRISRIEIPNTATTAKEALDLAKKQLYSEKEEEEKLISDTFYIETEANGEGVILEKEKIIYTTTIPLSLHPSLGKTFVEGARI